MSISLKGFSGRVVAPGDGEYDSARAMWRGLDRRPATIFQCQDVADIQWVVQYARGSGAPFAVMNTGHDVAGRTVPEGGVVLSTALLRDIAIDPERRTARVDPGVQWGELVAAAQPYGLATTGAAVASVGVLGFVLHGGLGLLMRRCGAGCDNVLELEMVTADGNLHTVNSERNPDLFWAMRGAGSNFGVVTSLTLRLHEVPRVVAGHIGYPAAQGRDVLEVYRQITSHAPEELVTDFFFRANPDGSHSAGIGVCFSGKLADAEAALAPLSALGPWRESIREMSTLELQALHEDSTPRGSRYHLRGHYLRELSDSAIEAILQHGARIRSPLTRIFLEHMGGAIARVSPGETSFSGRDASYTFLAIGGWIDPTQDAEHVAWTRALGDAIRPLSLPGGYVNYLDQDENHRIPSAYGEGYERLAELKRRYDPTNLFRANPNIPPQGDGQRVHAGDQERKQP